MKPENGFVFFWETAHVDSKKIFLQIFTDQRTIVVWVRDDSFDYSLNLSFFFCKVSKTPNISKKCHNSMFRVKAIFIFLPHTLRFIYFGREVFVYSLSLLFSLFWQVRLQRNSLFPTFQLVFLFRRCGLFEFLKLFFWVSFILVLIF